MKANTFGKVYCRIIVVCVSDIYRRDSTIQSVWISTRLSAGQSAAPVIKNAPRGFNLSHAKEFANALLDFLRA